MATFKKKPEGDRTCAQQGWNFDLPYADTFDHGQILVNIYGPMIEQFHIPKIFGIADKSINLFITTA